MPAKAAKTPTARRTSSLKPTAGMNTQTGTSASNDASEHTKATYKFPYGDFARVHRCRVLDAEVRAGQNNYRDIEDAALRLRDIMDEPGH